LTPSPTPFVPSPTPLPDDALQSFQPDAFAFTSSLPIDPVTLDPQSDENDLIRELEDANPTTCTHHTVITLPPGKVYTLTATHNSFFDGTGLPVIRCEVTINGTQTQIIRDPNLDTATPPDYFRIFGVNATGILRLNGIEVRNGYATSTGGGGILNVFGGQVYLNNTVVENNVANQTGTPQTLGGGIYSYEGVLEITSSRILNNRNDSLVGDGGGIGVINAQTMILNSEIADNTTTRDGGGAAILFTGNASVNQTCIYDNNLIELFANNAVDARFNWWDGTPSVSGSVNAIPPVQTRPTDCTNATDWQQVLPTPTPTATPTQSTITPGVCTVQVVVSSINAYISASEAAIALPGSEDHVFSMGDELEVDMRSELYQGIVQVRSQSVSGTYWLEDSINGEVTSIAGDCTQLPEASEPNNLIQQPTFTEYPLQVTSPSTYSLYQYAIVNQIYTGTVWRHPGMDFLQGPVSNGSISVGIRVNAVADGEIIGYFDPNKSPSLANISGASWVAGVSPTDTMDTPNRAYVVIRHGNVIVVYAHLQPGLRVIRTGNTVIAGQWLGQIAAHPNGAHLHLETRTYGLAPFDTGTVPLIFVNPWWYFDSANQGHINQNLVNRSNDDGQTVATPSTQLTHCLRSSASPPSGAPTSTLGIDVYGLTAGGSPTYRAFEWLQSNMRQVYVVPGHTTDWQVICIPTN